MTIIDSQVHAYEANTPKRPWHSVPNWPDHVTGDEMAVAMDKVGVDGAIFISAFSMYRYDASYAVEVQRAHPGRFAIVKPVDPDDPAVGDIIADWKQTPGAVGIRIMMTKERNREPNDPGLERILRAAVKHGQFTVLGQRGCGHSGDRPPPRYAFHHRPSGYLAAPHTTSPVAALGRPAEGAGPCQTQERVDQGERRLHAVPGTVSVPGHLGPTRPRVRCLGFRPLPVGHGLDTRMRRRQLRASRRTLPQD
jgi:Amidohydrolase